MREERRADAISCRNSDVKTSTKGKEENTAEQYSVNVGSCSYGEIVPGFETCEEEETLVKRRSFMLNNKP